MVPQTQGGGGRGSDMGRIDHSYQARISIESSKTKQLNN